MYAQTTKTAHRVHAIGTVRRDKDTVFLDIPEAYRPEKLYVPIEDGRGIMIQRAGTYAGLR